MPLDTRIGAELRYIDGSAGGRTVMIEYHRDGAELCVGEPVDRDDVHAEGLD